MLGIRDYRRSLERSRQALEHRNRPDTFDLCGRTWDLLPGVFAPVYSPTTEFSLRLLGLDDPAAGGRTGSLLEIGCGTGVIAVAGALAGHDRVVAADINEAAVRNAVLNARRHGVADRVRGAHGDLFDAIPPGERFDTVFWHSNYVLAPAEYRYRTMHERGYVDPGYATHRRFLTDAFGVLAPGGTVLLHFSARGDLDTLSRVAGECGRGLRVVRGAVFREGEYDVEHLLIEVTGTPRASGGCGGAEPPSGTGV
ncbi:class I SAM-dependent methyltransferase [Streptomyces yaizuensis]|uniref:50S ribosomal protein L11 methyltransferase n=1 Tax=Streptomyces yaizuensis TaxID=2989713 RepID=A0ABQ5NQM5_9ACTN|nr:class I SAM-dependent methyltransferase [Streptomyces sp. YSPA8]GLF92640.1 50S ribosomal protein L11 methyltransferase [Streptomyces sp. YSPA8]